MEKSDLERIKNIIQPCVEELYHSPIKKIRRFETGLCHYVYELKLKNGKKMVFRIGSRENKNKLVGSIFWHKQLGKLDIKVPEMYHYDLDCIKYNLPWTISERIPGDDIGNVLCNLDDAQLDTIAKEVVDIQKRIALIGEGPGFGEAVGLDKIESLKGKWIDFLYEKITIIGKRMATTGIFDNEYLERVEELTRNNANYFNNIRPLPFFDDLTSKNVLVSAGRFSGIVDYDTMTIGDRLYWLGLCNMVFIYLGREAYIGSLIKYLECTEKELEILDYYTLLFCVDLMSEIGQKFNNDQVIIDLEKVEKYKEIFKKIDKSNNLKSIQRIPGHKNTREC